jgi:hypothetical protein
MITATEEITNVTAIVNGKSTKKYDRESSLESSTMNTTKHHHHHRRKQSSTRSR